MTDWVDAHLVMILAVATVVSVNSIAAYFPISDHPINKFGSWVVRLCGFAASLILLAATPFLIVSGVQNWDPQSNLAYGGLALIALAFVASVISLVAFPLTTIRAVRQKAN